MSDNNPIISPLLNGPLLVKGLSTISGQQGPVETETSMALCRCGASNNKPYCDGSHNAIDFSSTCEADAAANKRVSYKGEKVTILDNRSICAHAGICTDELASVFRLHETPFIEPDGATAEAVIEVIRKCPSGALSYSLDESEPANEKGDCAIFIVPNGPYVISGEVDITDTPRAEGYSKSQATLCRCGASKNKPFCDGSHWSIEFKAD